MDDGVLEPLLNKGKELEKKYEWLQATKLYQKAVDLTLEDKDLLKTVELQEQIGFCFYRAAFQAQTNVEFRKLLKRAIRAYEKESKLLGGIGEANDQARITHAHALIAYTRSWIETSPPKRKELIDKWWTLEKQALKAYETAGDLHWVGRVCNNIMEWNTYDRWFLNKNFSEREKKFKEAIHLGEKSIQVLSQLDDKYELAKAYCFASWHYTFSRDFFMDEDKIIQLSKKCQDYANKALELSQEIGDAWLIARSYHSAWGAAEMLKANPISAAEIGKNILKYGIITKDNCAIGIGKSLTSVAIVGLSFQLEDPDKQREELNKAIKLSREATNNFQIINFPEGLYVSIGSNSIALMSLAIIEADPKGKRDLLEMANRVIQEGIERFRGWKFYSSRFSFYFALSMNQSLLSDIKRDLSEKRDLLQKTLCYQEKELIYLKEIEQPGYPDAHFSYYHLALNQHKLANMETNSSDKINLLNKAVVSIEKAIELAEKRKKLLQTAWASGFYFGPYNRKLGEILQQLYSLTKEKKKTIKAIEAFKHASFYYKKAEMPTHVAESNWHTAQLYDELGESQEASNNYKLASKAYDQASEKIPQLKDFYENYSKYMQAWSQIEQARYSHSLEEYNKAKENYKKSAELHESTEHWSYLASNYFAWASMEEAEDLSRNEKTQQAKQAFQEALQQFSHAKESIKQKLEEITISEEKEMTHKLFEASDLRRKYCQARILMEEAKLLDRDGKHLQSSMKYREAAQNISVIVDKMDFEAERKELEYVAILCRAWEKMAVAEEATSAESYLDAAELFGQAKNRCYTKKASLWALGNSNFCRGLAAGLQYKTSLDLADHARAKGYIKTASNDYLQAGFKNASEYAKAIQRLFDAYVIMNQAEGEISQEKRAKRYQLAENLLQIAAGSFMKAKQPEKTAQVQAILANVKEEKALAISLSQVMQAPTIASTTQSFAAPTPTREASVGLESFEHANVQANLVTQVNEVKVGESFCLSVEFVNAGREPALLLRVDDFVPSDFVVVKKPEIYRLEESALNMKGKQIAPLKLVEAKLVLQPSKKGEYQLNPRVYYLDERGQNKTLQLKTLEIKVNEVIFEDRVSTGTKELDSLLLGGIPQEYAVVLTGPPSDEREYLIRNFLEAGIKDDEIVFYVSTEAEELENLLEKPNFILFLCNPKPKSQVPDLPNVYKLRSKTDLTNLSISLAKAYRNIDPSRKKRICVEIVSNVLLDYEAKATCMWVSELITDLGSKGFTILAVIDPLMHASEELHAILGLFDGEISLTITKDPLECKKSIRVEKLRNQDYIKNPICLT